MIDILLFSIKFTNSKLYPKSDILAKDPIEAILTAADKNGQNVFIGVGNNYGRAGEPEDIEELFERYHSHKSFYGWYFACELNMEKFRPEYWDKLNRNTIKARKLSPAKPILMSPYCQPGPEFIKYIETHDDDEKSIMAEYQMLRGLSEEAQEALAKPCSYIEMKDWFLKKFPAIAEFHKKRESLLAAA